MHHSRRSHMLGKLFTLLISLTLISLPSWASVSRTDAKASAKGVKEWTFLIFLNGNNNLDPFGKMNIKQMEKIGSTDQVNIVVQWASAARKSTAQRLYINKDPSGLSDVVSPVIQEMGD